MRRRFHNQLVLDLEHGGTAPAATGAGGAAQRAGRPAARSPRQSKKRDTDRAGGM